MLGDVIERNPLPKRGFELRELLPACRIDDGRPGLGGSLEFEGARRRRNQNGDVSRERDYRDRCHHKQAPEQEQRLFPRLPIRIAQRPEIAAQQPTPLRADGLVPVRIAARRPEE